MQATVKAMFLSSPVTVIILAEIVFLLLVAIFFLWLVIRRQRQHHRFLLSEYRKIRRNARIEFGPTALHKLASPSRDDSTLDPVAEFLLHARQEALVRFQHTARAKLPRLSADLPFSAKVAALRYFYTLAEHEVHQQLSIHNEAWMRLEKSLAEIVRWIVTPQALPESEPDSGPGKLQEALDTLSATQTENMRLRAELESSLNKQQRMAEAQKEHKDEHARMQRIIDVLQLANTYKGEKVESKTQEALLLIDRSHALSDLDNNYQSSAHQLDNIEQVSSRKHSLLRNITDNLPFTHKALTAEQRLKLEGIIKALERDLLVSDNQIVNLQNSLKTTRDSLKKRAVMDSNIPVTPFNQYSPAKLHEIDHRSAPLTKDVLTIIHNSPNEQKERLPSSWDIQGGRQQTLAEIEQLRLNNQNQRNMIIDLDKELRHLRSSLDNSVDKSENLETIKNIARLERFVTECENYIKTLEHQVDSLHRQLNAESSKNLGSISLAAPKAEPQSPVNEPQQEFQQEPQQQAQQQPQQEPQQKLHAISHQLRQTIKLHSDMGVLNRFYVNAVNCQSLEALAKAIINSLKDLHVCAGFFLHSTLGKAEFYHHNEFTSDEQKVMRQAAKLAPITHSKDRTLFARSRIGLMLKGLLADDDLQHHLEQTLNNIAQFVDHHIIHMETLAGHHQQLKQAEKWIDYTKQSISELDTHYAFQVEGLQIVDDLVQELKRATSTAEMSEGARAVFNNATDECYQRLQLLLESGKKINLMSHKLRKALNHLDGKAASTSQIFPSHPTI